MFTHVNQPPIPTLIQNTKPNGTRTYEVPNNKVYPSITTILGDGDKPWLTNWRNVLGDKRADKETKRCAIRGTAIHKMAELYVKNIPIDFRKYLPAHVRDFNKLKTQLNAMDNIAAQEIALYSDRLKVAGTVDCIAEYNGTPSIIDYKTSTNVKTKDMVTDYFCQLTFYAIAWHELTGNSIENIVVMMTVENGLLPIVFVERIENWIPLLLSKIAVFQAKHK